MPIHTTDLLTKVHVETRGAGYYYRVVWLCVCYLCVIQGHESGYVVVTGV